MSELIDAFGAAKKLGFSTRSGLYHAIARHGIPHVRLGDSLRFDPADLDRYIDLLKKRAHTCPSCGQHTRRLRKVI
jgi:excisionase family DNA binding protein